MRRYLCGLLACISIFSGLCTSAKAAEVESRFEFEQCMRIFKYQYKQIQYNL